MSKFILQQPHYPVNLSVGDYVHFEGEIKRVTSIEVNCFDMKGVPVKKVPWDTLKHNFKSSRPSHYSTFLVTFLTKTGMRWAFPEQIEPLQSREYLSLLEEHDCTITLGHCRCLDLKKQFEHHFEDIGL